MKLPNSSANKGALPITAVLQPNVPAMIWVTYDELTRVPVERLARLLMDRAADDPMLLARLHATIAEQGHCSAPSGVERTH